MSEPRAHMMRRAADSCDGDLERCPLALDAADTAVRKVFAILGVDVDTPRDVEEFRKDLRFGGSMRTAVNRGVLGVVGVVVLAILTALWTGIKVKVGGG